MRLCGDDNRLCVRSVCSDGRCSEGRPPRRSRASQINKGCEHRGDCNTFNLAMSAAGIEGSGIGNPPPQNPYEQGDEEDPFFDIPDQVEPDLGEKDECGNTPQDQERLCPTECWSFRQLDKCYQYCKKYHCENMGNYTIGGCMHTVEAVPDMFCEPILATQGL